jgi:hypothetical protein
MIDHLIQFQRLAVDKNMFEKPGKMKETKMMTEKKKMEVREHNKKLDNVQIIKFDMQEIKNKIENIKK